MKRLNIIAVSIAILTACNKKETKTITQIDPKTGKSVTIEVPTQDSTNIEKNNKEQLAIKDSAGIYTQNLKLEIGKTYPFTTYQKDVSTSKMPDGKSQSITRESTDVINFKVTNFENGVYDMDLFFVSKKTSQNGMGISQVVDTKATAPKDEGLKNRWSIDKALTNNTLKMKVKSTGEIVSITGFEPIYTKISTTINSLTEEKAQRKAVLEQIKSSFNEKIIREQFEKNIFIIPKKGVKIGGTWNQSENASENGKVKITSNYTLKKVENGFAEITVSGGIPKTSDKQTQQGITQTISSELKQNGSFLFDVQTGWIKTQKVTITTTQSQSFSDGKQSETMSNTTITTVIVNPS